MPLKILVTCFKLQVIYAIQTVHGTDTCHKGVRQCKFGSCNILLRQDILYNLCIYITEELQI